MDKLCLEINRLLWSAWEINCYFWHFCGTVSSKMIHSAGIYWSPAVCKTLSKELVPREWTLFLWNLLTASEERNTKQADKKGNYRPMCYKWNYKKLRKRRTRGNCKARPLWRAIWAKTDRMESRSRVSTCDVQTTAAEPWGRGPTMCSNHWTVLAEDWKVSGWPEARAISSTSL